LMWRKWV